MSYRLNKKKNVDINDMNRNVKKKKNVSKTLKEE